jgi:hypothetical protein
MVCRNDAFDAPGLSSALETPVIYLPCHRSSEHNTACHNSLRSDRPNRRNLCGKSVTGLVGSRNRAHLTKYATAMTIWTHEGFRNPHQKPIPSRAEL